MASITHSSWYKVLSFPLSAPHTSVSVSVLVNTELLENVEHCGGEPEQADTGYYVTDE